MHYVLESTATMRLTPKALRIIHIKTAVLNLQHFDTEMRLFTNFLTLALADATRKFNAF